MANNIANWLHMRNANNGENLQLYDLMRAVDQKPDNHLEWPN